MIMKTVWILLFGLILGIGTSVGIAAVTEDTCSYDPKSGYFYDTDTKEWSANGSWDEAVACAKEGKLPAVVADRLGIWGDKQTQIEGRKWATINSKVKAEKAAKEAKAAADAAEKSAAKAKAASEKIK
jgi:hypothetical protein